MTNVTTLCILLVCIFTINVCARSQDEGWKNTHLRVRRDSSDTKYTVQNLQSVCEQLCSQGIGGHVCGPRCSLKSTPIDGKSSLINGVNDGKCSILCLNGLGIPNCECKIESTTETHLNMNSICGAFCDNDITLNGCSSCPKKSSNMKKAFELTTEPTTTPDWEELCIILCKMGQGGALCNCDIPPFFRK